VIASTLAGGFVYLTLNAPCHADSISRSTVYVIERSSSFANFFNWLRLLTDNRTPVISLGVVVLGRPRFSTFIVFLVSDPQV